VVTHLDDPDSSGGSEDISTEIRAFLIADVRGYTLFTQQRGDEAAAKLAAKFAQLTREGVEARGGQVVELRGDEALCVFASPRQAIRAAVELQDRFVDETLADPALPLAVGIGLDAGEAVPVEGGFRGGALNLAARLSGRAGPGEIVVSREIAHLARRVEGVRYTDRGEVSLKGLADPVTVIEVSSEAAPAASRLASLIPQREPAIGGSDEGPIRVIVVDDHPAWRDGIRFDLEASGIAIVVAEAADGGEAIELAKGTEPDVVLMDLHLPTVSGVDAIARIVQDAPSVKVLVLSASGEESDVLEAVKVGAAGYLLKSSSATEICDAVQQVHKGEPVFTSPLAGLVLAEFRRVATAPAAGEVGLTARENEVLRLVAKGYTYREIAEKLFISVKTVQNHVQNILAKLQLHKRYELMRYAIQKGLDRAPE
jgi:DNA-binding NarL/FixJ family response regulator/class 3 adenylate cyclase